MIPRGLEEVAAFLLCEQAADMADGLPERIVRAGGGSSDQGLELRECHLDRVQSGLQGGRNRNHAPTAFRAAAAVGLLCDDGLSRMIASPLCNLFTDEECFNFFRAAGYGTD